MGSFPSSNPDFNPIYIWGEFITNLLGFLLSSLLVPVSKYIPPLVLNPIALSEYTKTESDLALNTNLSEFIITWEPLSYKSTGSGT